MISHSELSGVTHAVALLLFLDKTFYLDQALHMSSESWRLLLVYWRNIYFQTKINSSMSHCTHTLP